MGKGQDLFNNTRRDKICIVGFAESKRQLGNFLSDDWVRWGVNDLYHYLPGIDVVFEVHHLDNLGARRNAEHLQSLATGQFRINPDIAKAEGWPPVHRELPVVLLEDNPNLATAMVLPASEIEQTFGTEYFTSSIAWMIAFAILELTEVKEIDGRKTRIAREGAQLALVGIHMAADTEYAAQRPCAEYWVGVARGLGIPVYVPDEADILKSAAKYGFVSSSPVAVKIQSRLLSLKEQTIKLQQQEGQLMQQLEMVRGNLAAVRGAKQELNMIHLNYCMPTDIMPGDPRGLTEQQQKDRGVLQLETGEMVPQIQLSDGQPQEAKV